MATAFVSFMMVANTQAPVPAKLRHSTMTKITALALFLLALPVCAATGIQEIHLYLSITEGEHSKDSHSTTTTITINGNRLVYDQTYAGYRAGRRTPVHKEIDIKEEDVTKLKGLIKEKRLLESASLERQTDGQGRYSAIMLNVLTEKKKSPIKISGMTKEIEGEKLYQNVQALRGEIERVMGNSK